MIFDTFEDFERGTLVNKVAPPHYPNISQFGMIIRDLVDEEKRTHYYYVYFFNTQKIRLVHREWLKAL